MRRLNRTQQSSFERTLLTATVLFIMLCALLVLLASLGQVKPIAASPAEGATNTAAQPGATLGGGAAAAPPSTAQPPRSGVTKL